jgi:hypothetical protein
MLKRLAPFSLYAEVLTRNTRKMMGKKEGAAG